ncbi:hypothetical protein CPB84DRAFT_1856849 [Gymnopilus junonius]|uniref:Uncharacterized protein n=1 Tax=Gymnopilus junonius TaxID=109634 RepID=A0A9P5TFR5_GYMJU|nr:hypothetical protein CPB84DRAFT_1856849 [Gymnopilus junonius]
MCTILSSVYNFHASASAYTQFWNDSNSNNTNSIQITCHQVWQLFVQESIRAVATAHNRDLKMPNNLDIKGVVKEAFAQLGNNGVVDIGIHHECSECSHPYKSSAGNVGQHNDPASVAGLDETNSDIPVLTRDDADNSVQYTEEDRWAHAHRQRRHDEEMEVDDYKPVKMVVVDGHPSFPQTTTIAKHRYTRNAATLLNNL